MYALLILAASSRERCGEATDESGSPPAYQAPRPPKRREALGRLLADALDGRSRVTVLRGEAGVGKSALLGYLSGRAVGWHVARAAGVESDLVAVWRTTGGHRFRNYRARFTVLDVPSVSRAWISELASGQTTGESCPAPAAGVLLALLAAALHAVYILLGRRGWDRADDGAATFLIVATAALGLGAIAAATRPATMLAPASDLPLTGLLLLDGALAGAAAPLLFLAGLRRTGATRTAVVSLCEPLAAALLATVMLGQLLSSSQLAGGALLLGAGIAIQTVPARPVRSARVGQAPRTGTRQPRAPATKQSHLRSRDHGNQLEQHEAHR